MRSSAMNRDKTWVRVPHVVEWVYGRLLLLNGVLLDSGYFEMQASGNKTHYTVCVEQYGYQRSWLCHVVLPEWSRANAQIDSEHR
jgi:hypothetical protein